MLAYIVAVIRWLIVSLAWLVLQYNGLVQDPAPRAGGWIMVHVPPVAGWRRLAKLLMVRAWVRNGYNAYGNYLQMFTQRARELAVLNGEIEDESPPPRVPAAPKPKARPARPRR